MRKQMQSQYSHMHQFPLVLSLARRPPIRKDNMFGDITSYGTILNRYKTLSISDDIRININIIIGILGVTCFQRKGKCTSVTHTSIFIKCNHAITLTWHSWCIQQLCEQIWCEWGKSCHVESWNLSLSHRYPLFKLCSPLVSSSLLSPPQWSKHPV